MPVVLLFPFDEIRDNLNETPTSPLSDPALLSLNQLDQKGWAFHLILSHPVLFLLKLNQVP